MGKQLTIVDNNADEDRVSELLREIVQTTVNLTHRSDMGLFAREELGDLKRMANELMAIGSHTPTPECELAAALEAEEQDREPLTDADIF